MLPRLVEWLYDKDIPLRCRAKQDVGGKHVAPFWVYAVMDARAPSKSEVQAFELIRLLMFSPYNPIYEFLNQYCHQVGCTDYADVNPFPHLWVRGNDGPYVPKMIALLLVYIVTSF